MSSLRRGVCFVLVLGIGFPIFAAPFTGKDQGTRGPSVLRQEPGVRAAGMGGASVAVSEDSTGVFWNPGALQQTSQQDLSLAHSDSFGQTYNFLSYTLPVWWAGDRRTVGISVGNLSFPTLDVVENLEPQGSVHPQETVVGFTYAQPWSSLSVGGTAKWVSTQAGDEGAQTYAFDAGIFGPILAERGWWGVTMQNVGPGIKSDEGTTGLPFVLRAGLAWHLFPATQVRKKGLLLTGEIDAPIDDTPRPRAGLEYEIRLKETVRTQFRGGWRSTAGTVEEGELSLGFGLTARTIRFNYAYVPNQALGANQWVDVGFQFGGLPARQVERDKLLAEAQSQLNEGRLTAAEATLEGVLKISPKNPTARQMASDIQRRFDQSVHPETLYILGDRAFARESYGEAVEYLQKLILVDPNHVEGKKLLATAEAKVARARADRVKKDMAAARQKETNDLLRRAKSKTNQGEWLLALPAWRQVLAQDHANQQGKAGVQQAQEALYAEARAFESAGQWEKAISIYQTMKEDDPTFKDCSKRQSSLNDQRRTQNRERAQGKYEEGLRALKQNKIMEARHLFQEAVDLDPKNKTFIKALERTHP